MGKLKDLLIQISELRNQGFSALQIAEELKVSVGLVRNAFELLNEDDIRG